MWTLTVSLGVHSNFLCMMVNLSWYQSFLMELLPHQGRVYFDDVYCSQEFGLYLQIGSYHARFAKMSAISSMFWASKLSWLIISTNEMDSGMYSTLTHRLLTWIYYSGLLLHTCSHMTPCLVSPIFLRYVTYSLCITCILNVIDGWCSLPYSTGFPCKRIVKFLVKVHIIDIGVKILLH